MFGRINAGKGGVKMIDKNAIVSSKAELASDVSVGPFAVIGPNVKIDSGTSIGANTIIQGKTTIGKNNKIFHLASIGADPQHKQYNNEPTSLEIGDNNVIREFCSIHRGTVQGSGFTKIGNNNLFMAYTHIAHDCILGNEIVFANNATLAGHVTIGDYVVLGGFTKILQFCTLGDYCFISADTGIIKDVLPFVLVAGYHDRTKVYGLNLIGLKRNGFGSDKIRKLKQAYDIIFRSDIAQPEIIDQLEKMIPECKEIELFINMLKNSKRGIVKT